jgi:GTP cyclohydrolase II
MSALPLIAPSAIAQLPTRFGTFALQVFTDQTGHEHMALAAGTLGAECLVRVHSECATGDILGSLRCDCREQLELALQAIAASGNGLLVYMRGHEGRGIGLANKIAAYALQEQGADTVAANLQLGFAADARNYDVAAAMLQHFGLRQIKLLTNNPRKLAALTAHGITISARVPLWVADNPHNAGYLRSKQSLLAHLAAQ